MPKRVRELIERRTANSKHWLRDDALVEAEIYIGPVHYRDEHGRWQDIETDIEDRAEVVEGEGYGLRVVKAPFRAHFGRSAKAPQRFEIWGKGHLILRPLGTRASHAQINRNKAVYQDAWQGVDWVRTVLPAGVKSDFVLKDRSAPNEFRFRVQAGGLDYRQLPDGTIQWIRSGAVVAAFRAPTVRDAAGTEGVARQWIESGQAGLELVLHVDKTWLEKATFPVKMDPTIVLQEEAGTDDAEVYVGGNTYPPSGTPTVSQQAETGPTRSYVSSLGKYYIKVALFRWNTNGVIPAGAIVTSAKARMTVTNVSSADARNLTADWYPGSNWPIDAADYIETAQTSAIPGIPLSSLTAVVTYDFDLSNPDANVVRNGYTGLRFHISGGQPTGYNYVQFAAFEYTDAAKRPQLVLTYNIPPSVSSPTPGGTSSDPARVNTTTPRLSWAFSDPDGDTQAAYQVVITRDADNVIVKDTGEVASSSNYYDVPAGTLVEGVKYRWKVRVKDSGGLWSAYTSEVYIYTNRAPSVSPISPLGTSASPAIISNSTTPRLEWSFSDPDGDAQQEFRVVITRANDNVVIRDTGWIASPNQYWDVPAGDLAYGTTYYWQVQVSDPYGRQSALTTPQYFQPNRTPNGPTGLSPAGTVADPAEVNTLTPTLAWTHNDPDLEPQYSFQVLIYRASDNALVHDSGEVVSGTSSYTVPANVLSGSTKYYWRVRTKDTGSLLFGPYSSDAYIYTNQAPYAPTNLSPASGAVFDATTVKRFSWTFQDPDIVPIGDAQSAFQVLIYRVSDGVLVHDSGKVVSANQYYDLPANTLANGVDYQWKVRTWDLQDQVGPDSPLASFRTGRPPAVSITSPADAGTYGKGILTVQWSYSDPDTDPQVQYQAMLKNGAGVVIEGSGVIASAATQHQFATILTNNTQYQVTVTVWDATGQSASDTNTFTTSFVPPTTPVLGLVADDVGDKIVLTITNPDNDPAKPATARNDLYRRKQGETGWTRVAKGLPKNGGYDDYAVASGAVYEYKVVAISVDETTAESAVQSGGVSFLGVWLHDPADPANTARHFLYDGRAREEVWEPEAELLQFAGRTLPVAEFGQQTDERVRVTLQLLKNSGDLEALRALARRRTVLCYRDGTGRKVFGVVTALPVSDQPYGAEVTVEVTSVAYSEAV